MNVKKLKRVCGVRGCKNLGAFTIARTRETGNSVIICRECLKEALEAVENYMEPEKKETGKAQALFYHPEISGDGAEKDSSVTAFSQNDEGVKAKKAGK